MFRDPNRLAPIGDDVIEGLGLTLTEMRAVARRQLAGSIVAGVLVVAAAALVGLCSMGRSSPDYTAAKSGVQQPEFVQATDRLVAGRRRAIELP
jgi:hypothetical protein